MNDETRTKLNDLINGAKICMMTTMTAKGNLVSRPMGLQHAEFDGDLWFFTFSDSNKAQHIAVNPKVNIAFSDQKHNSWISLSGNARMVDDKDKMRDLWNPFLKAWFTDGLETPKVTLIKIETESAEFWDSHNSTAVNLFGMVKAAVTGSQPDIGENKSVEL